MNSSRLMRTLIVLGGSVITGCATPVPVVSHTLRCDANAELMASQCARPKPIADDATFEMVIATMRDDRHALQECGILLDSLRESINRCNQQVDAFNEKIDEMNRANADR